MIFTNSSYQTLRKFSCLLFKFPKIQMVKDNSYSSLTLTVQACVFRLTSMTNLKTACLKYDNVVVFRTRLGWRLS